MSSEYRTCPTNLIIQQEKEQIAVILRAFEAARAGLFLFEYQTCPTNLIIQQEMELIGLCRGLA